MTTPPKLVPIEYIIEQLGLKDKKSAPVKEIVATLPRVKLGKSRTSVVRYRKTDVDKAIEAYIAASATPPKNSAEVIVREALNNAQ